MEFISLNIIFIKIAQPYNRGRVYQPKEKYRTNEKITVPFVMLIDEEAGENHGKIATEVALEMASTKGLDLVEVSPKMDPPVCKIMDYSKFKYLTAKKEKKAKSKNKQKEMKEMRFPVHIDSGDVGHKIKRVREFLDKGHNVRINIYLKGRINPGQEVDLMNNILTELSEECKIDQSPKKEGRNYSVIVIPANNAKDKDT